MATRLSDYLPAVLREDPFLAKWLWGFERILTGAGGDPTPIPDVTGATFPHRGIEETVAHLADYLDPLDPTHAPSEFLPWLASWMAFTLRYDMDEGSWRALIADSVRLYRRRGTAGYIVELLQKFTKGSPRINELTDANTNQPLPPHTFQVTLALMDRATFKQTLFTGPVSDVDAAYNAFVQRQEIIGNGLIELAKPAHTSYSVTYDFPSMQINVHSTVGVDTLLGQAH